eukprot:1014107-Pleurochrysis_carterae.AAC.2
MLVEGTGGCAHEWAAGLCATRPMLVGTRSIRPQLCRNAPLSTRIVTGSARSCKCPVWESSSFIIMRLQLDHERAARQ